MSKGHRDTRYYIVKEKFLNQKLRTGIIFSGRLLLHQTRFGFSSFASENRPLGEAEFFHMVALDEPQSHYYHANIVAPLNII